VHVTLKLRRDAPRLRGGRTARVLRSAIRAGSERLGLRVVHYSIQSNHVHLVCEAKDAQALSRGIQGLEIRLARRLNRAHGRTGRVWADRYHARILRTPREVRNCLVYVLGNWRHHGGERYPAQSLDPYSSAAWFDGFREKLLPLPEGAERPTATARTWLLGVGWRKRGLISVVEGAWDTGHAPLGSPLLFWKAQRARPLMSSDIVALGTEGIAAIKELRLCAVQRYARARCREPARYDP
jgi:REP element-mobilizing transposase RayT